MESGVWLTSSDESKLYFKTSKQLTEQPAVEHIASSEQIIHLTEMRIEKLLDSLADRSWELRGRSHIT